MTLRSLSFLAFLSLLAAPAALGQQAAKPAEIPLVLELGASGSICPCPVSGLVCDDPSLVEVVQSETDVSLRGVKVGTTLCSVRDAVGIRRFYRVTVRERKEAQDAPGQGK
jgi:hypothetical protein